MIGDLNQRVSLLKKTQTADGGGGTQDVWDSFASVWASVTWNGTAETNNADTAEVRVRYIVVIRLRDDIGAGQRVGLGSRTFEVVSVQNDANNVDTMKLHCEEMQ